MTIVNCCSPYKNSARRILMVSGTYLMNGKQKTPAGTFNYNYILNLMQDSTFKLDYITFKMKSNNTFLNDKYSGKWSQHQDTLTLNYTNINDSTYIFEEKLVIKEKKLYKVYNGKRTTSYYKKST